MSKKILLLTITAAFILSACGLTTKELIRDKQKNQPDNIYVVTTKGIAHSLDGGEKWRTLLPVSRYHQETILEIIQINKRQRRIITNKAIYTQINSTITTNVTINIKDTAILNDKVYLLGEKNIYIYHQETLVTQNMPLVENLFTYHQTLAGVSNNQLLVLSPNKKSWKQIYIHPEEIKQLFSVKENLFIISNSNLSKIILPKASAKEKNIITKTLKTFTKTFNPTASYIGDKIYLAGNNKLLKSTSGANWDEFTTDTGFIEGKIHKIIIVGLRIYLASDKGLIYSLNGGETWHKLTKSHGLPSSNVLNIFMN